MERSAKPIENLAISFFLPSGVLSVTSYLLILGSEGYGSN